MTAIERISFQNRLKKECAFEIVDLQVFMSTRPHHHLNREFRINFWTLMYITKGEGTHFIDFEPYQYKAGDIVIIQKNQVNRFLVNSDAEGYIIIINVSVK
jgi:mannose-6-phosphate isomerase-like protein (cupin superfamily)